MFNKISTIGIFNKYLKKKIKSKGSSIKYGDRLEMQDYIKPNKVLTYEEQVELFSYRSEMNEVSLKFKEYQEFKSCLCNEELNNIHIFQCKILNNGEYPENTYEELLNGTLHKQKFFLNIMKKNLEQLRKITKAARADSWLIVVSWLLMDQYIYMVLM